MKIILLFILALSWLSHQIKIGHKHNIVKQEHVNEKADENHEFLSFFHSSSSRRYGRGGRGGRGRYGDYRSGRSRWGHGSHRYWHQKKASESLLSSLQ